MSSSTAPAFLSAGTAPLFCMGPLRPDGACLALQPPLFVRSSSSCASTLSPGLGRIFGLVGLTGDGRPAPASDSAGTSRPYPLLVLPPTPHSASASCRSCIASLVQASA